MPIQFAQVVQRTLRFSVHLPQREGISSSLTCVTANEIVELVDLNPPDFLCSVEFRSGGNLNITLILTEALRSFRRSCWCPCWKLAKTVRPAFLLCVLRTWTFGRARVSRACVCTKFGHNADPSASRGALSRSACPRYCPAAIPAFRLPCFVGCGYFSPCWLSVSSLFLLPS